MAEAVDTNLQDAGQFAICERCGRKSGLNWSFAFGKPIRAEEPAGGAIIKCALCAIRHIPMLKRSLIVAAVVGTILTLLNQGDVFFSGSWNSALYWKVPITYCVPFCVATYGALSNSRRRFL